MFISRLLPYKLAKRYGTDTSGVAAVEFALIVPIALAMLLGSIEYSRAVLVARRFNLITSMASDLIAREQTMDDTVLAGIKHGIETVWDPNGLNGLTMNVYQVRAARDTATKKPPGQAYVDWRFQLIGSAPIKAKCENYSISTTVLPPGAVTVIVQSTYTYTTLFGTQAPGISSSSIDWSSTSSHSPRNLCVDYNKTNCLSTCE
jgi:Flp pilus assembly protein TadG